MGLLFFTFLLIVVFLHKIIFCCIHGRALVAIRHKCGFALWLFDVSRQEFIKAGLAEELLHGGDAEQLFLIRVKACFLDRVNDGGLVAVSAVAASFDELKASPFLTGESLLQSVLLNTGSPANQFIYLAENDLNLGIRKQWRLLEIMLRELQICLGSGATFIFRLAEAAPFTAQEIPVTGKKPDLLWALRLHPPSGTSRPC